MVRVEAANMLGNEREKKRTMDSSNPIDVWEFED